MGKKYGKIMFRMPFRSIRSTMLFSFSAFIVMTLFAYAMISLHFTEKTVLHNSIDYTSRLMKQINGDIDSYIDYMENISSMVVNSSEVQRYMFHRPQETDSMYQQILTQFNTVVETRQDISNIGVISLNGESIINNGQDILNPNIALEDVDWYLDALEEEGTQLSSSHVQNVIKDNYKWVVTLSRGIINPFSGEKAGVFFIDLNYKVIKDLCENNDWEPNHYLFITDENGRIIYHPKQQLLYSDLREERIQEVLECKSNYFLTDEGEKSQLYTISKSEKTGWYVVGVSALADFMKEKDDAERLYLLTAVLLLFLALLLAVFLSAAITRPIKKLKLSMGQVEKGNFENASIEVRDVNEIGSLSNSFNIMTYRIQQLMEQNIQEQEQKRTSELKALQAQINPHFLYNTLDSIIWMAEGNKNQEVVIMTSSLAKLLRQSISNENELVPLGKEVEYTVSYLTIQKMRYRDKMDFEIQMEDEIKQVSIIKLILQPIVENAIYHGIKYKEGKGLILIKGYEMGEDAIIEVCDNGIGMKPETLAQIWEGKKEEGENGVGVMNVQMRLKLYYGENYGISFSSEYESGTKVTIRIPKRKLHTGGKNREGNQERL